MIGLALGLLSQAQINLAGVYEGEMNDNITRKRMYLNIDFLNGVPDFTQIFTTKESPLKVLPKDFMNAKKLKKDFAGQHAPGFARYNSKTLFSSTEELMLTNPQLEDGILTAEWVNNEGKKGKCFIVANSDNTIQILGLTSLEPDFGPDNLRLTLVDNRLPDGTQPYITAPELLEKVNKRYCREILWKLKIDRSKGLGGIRPSIDKEQVRRIGNDILVPVQFYNKGSKEARPDFGSHNPFERNELVTIGGNPFCIVSADGNLEKSIGVNETAMQRFTIVGVPLDAQKIDNMKIKGRAQYTHSTEKNPYGDYEYKFTDLVLPELHPSNHPGSFITDSDLQLILNNTEAVGKDLVIDFTLINHSKRDKQLSVNDKGIARTQDGEEYNCTAQVSESLAAQERVKGKMVITDGATVNFRLSRIPISIQERNLSYKAMLQF